MLTRANHIYCPGRSRQSGGTFFTMVIFVMMLISTALMYYYFQRTQALQREVAALKSGMGHVSQDNSSLWDWLPWNSNKGTGEAEEDALETAPAPAAGVSATPAAVASTPLPAPGVAEVDGSQLPPTGAASTPRPINTAESPESTPAMALDLGNEAGQDPQVLEPIEASSESDTEASIDSGRENASDEAERETQPPVSSDETESREPIQSMYDQLPPVRVRSPRQNQ